VTGANISVKISDDFLEAVEQDAEFTLKFPVDSPNPTYTKNIRARD
jgi:ribonucleoside-diphosphate reductase alpha chain